MKICLFKFCFVIGGTYKFYFYYKKINLNKICILFFFLLKDLLVIKHKHKKLKDIDRSTKNKNAANNLRIYIYIYTSDIKLQWITKYIYRYNNNLACDSKYGALDLYARGCEKIYLNFSIPNNALTIRL